MARSHLKTGKSASPSTRTTSSRVPLLVLCGVVLVVGAWFVRSSSWVREAILRGKDLGELEAIVRDHPDDSIAQYYLGKRYLLAHRYAEAAAACDAAVRLDPNSARARIELGHSLFAQGKRKEARSEFMQATRLDSRSAQAEYMVGKVAWTERDIKEALPHFKRATELDARFDEAWYGMGLCLIQTQHLEAALTAVEQAVAINANRPEYPATLGELELRLNDNTEDARRQFERSLQIDPNYGQACALMGEFLAQHYGGNEQAALARAEALLLKATKLSTYRPQDVVRNLGQVYLLQKQYGKAIPLFQESIRLEPNDERAYFALVKAYRGLKDAKAVEATQARFHFMSQSRVEKYSLETHLSVQPKDAEAHLKLAKLYLDFRLTVQAAYQYKLYLDLRPDAHDAAVEKRLRDQTAADAARLQQNPGFPSLQ